ncbi:MAG TPA: S9 family peptidase [Rhizomicrobium sp.]|jgi:dipeptidyl aminopeptidase/acylaminoacyl peptidase|nr:S9 family peptidase [Rhizomicrobium sp.]
MHLGRIFAGLVFILSAGAAQAAPLEAYGQLPGLDHLAISPDGTKLALETTINGQRTVVVTPVGANTLIAGLRVGDQKLRGLAWGDNDHLLITYSVTHTAQGVMGGRQEYLQVQNYSLSQHLQLQLMQNVAGTMNTIFGELQPRTVGGRSVVYLTGIAFMDRVGVATLFAIDLESGRTTTIEHGTPFTQSWVVDQNGNMVARTDYDAEHNHWSLKIRLNGVWKEAVGANTVIETPEVEGIGPDGTSLILSVPEDGIYRQKQISLADGSEMAPPDVDDGLPTLVEDPVTHRIIGTERLEVATDYHFFSKADQSAWRSAAAAFPGENVERVSWSDDRRRIIVRVDGPQDGAAYELVDLNTMHAEVIGPVYSAIDPTDVAEVKLITYKAADGTTIPAYLTLPNGRSPKGLPLIVLAHGGPAARDTPEFDWWSQALASRGYAVLQPEFRGSDGFGWAHMSAGFGQWGRKMQTDLSDGVRYLAAQGTVDAKRVCIVGASYGGYAALAGAALDPGVYRCAVADAGVSDPQGFLRWNEHRDHSSDDITMRYWERFMGVTGSDDPKLAEISPLAHVSSITIPILLTHGPDDTVVPIRQSEEMDSALRAAGKPVTFVRLSGEDHWLSRSETRLQMLTATVDFLEANNPPN